MELALIRERILATPLVKRLPEELRQRFALILLWISDTQEVCREQTLFKLGEKDTGRGCLILEGMVRIKTEGRSNKTIEAPDVLGEVQLFTPQHTRTATVEVVVGGKILSFAWNHLCNEAKNLYTEEEFAQIKRAITDSAWTREENLKEKLKSK